MPFAKEYFVKLVQKETDSTKKRSLKVVENLKEVIDSTSAVGEDICHLSLGGCFSKTKRNVE